MNATAGTIESAYKICGEIAQREAKNFYYAFLALPEAKRDAMYAIYAFMRRADDIADDESQSIEQRRVVMDAWLTDWRNARAGGETGDAVFVAVRDAQKKFNITDDLLEKLVRGVVMDLTVSPNDAGPIPDVQTYATFEDLYRYCYLVASVVGLVCIRVFGYTDPAAEKLAEETGIAFQLTNILRDVLEDKERGRIYLPLEDMAKFKLNPQTILKQKPGGKACGKTRATLEFEAKRAMEYYSSADKLMPMIDADSRPALKVLVSIYRELLGRIIAAKYEVFVKRVSVPAWKKMAILLRGMAEIAVRRVFVSKAAKA